MKEIRKSEVGGSNLIPQRIMIVARLCFQKRMFLDQANTQPKSIVGAGAVLLTRSKDVHQIKIPSQSQAQASTKLMVIRLLSMAQLASVRVRGQT